MKIPKIKIILEPRYKKIILIIFIITLVLLFLAPWANKDLTTTVKSGEITSMQIYQSTLESVLNLPLEGYYHICIKHDSISTSEAGLIFETNWHATINEENIITNNNDENCTNSKIRATQEFNYIIYDLNTSSQGLNSTLTIKMNQQKGIQKATYSPRISFYAKPTMETVLSKIVLIVLGLIVSFGAFITIFDWINKKENKKNRK